MPTGYVVRESYVRLAGEKAGGSELRELEDLIALVNEVNELELSFSTRLAAARGDAEPPELSVEAMEHVDLSADADTEVHRLLLRRCRRAESAHEVLVELLTMAEDELELDEDLVSEFESGDPALELHMELVQKKREVVARLQSATQGGP